MAWLPWEYSRQEDTKIFWDLNAHLNKPGLFGAFFFPFLILKGSYSSSRPQDSEYFSIVHVTSFPPPHLLKVDKKKNCLCSPGMDL